MEAGENSYVRSMSSEEISLSRARQRYDEASDYFTSAAQPSPYH